VVDDVVVVDVVVVDMMVVDVAEVVVVKVDSINDHVCFNMYNRLDFNHQY